VRSTASIPQNRAWLPNCSSKSDEAHIRTLAWDAKGNLIAGSDGSGLTTGSTRTARATCFLRLRVGDYVHCVGAKRNHLCGMRGRQEPEPIASAAVQGIASVSITVVHAVATGGQRQRFCSGRTEIFALTEGQAPRSSGPAKTQCLCARSPARRPPRALRKPRTIYRIKDDGNYADVVICRRSRG